MGKNCQVMDTPTETPAGLRVCLSRNEGAAALGLGRSTFAELIARGELQEIRIGRRSLIPLSEIDRFVRERLAAATIPKDAA
jgi:excisionase family DNA binding protein